MKSIPIILNELAPIKPTSRVQLYRYLRAAGISPIGVRTKPRLYPADTANRILTHLGLVENAEQSRIPSMKQLRAERSRGKALAV